MLILIYYIETNEYAGKLGGDDLALSTLVDQYIKLYITHYNAAGNVRVLLTVAE
jgi:hypothetical protein